MVPLVPHRGPHRLPSMPNVPTSAPIRAWNRTPRTHQLTADERQCQELGCTLPELKATRTRLLFGVDHRERPE